MVKRVTILIKRRFWFGWQRIDGIDYQWVGGRTCAAGLGYTESENGGKITTKLADVAFPLQLAVTLIDGGIIYIPNIATRTIIIREV